MLRAAGSMMKMLDARPGEHLIGKFDPISNTNTDVNVNNYLSAIIRNQLFQLYLE
jgi:hypothetical protein